MVAATIANDIYKSIGRYVIHKPRNLVSVGFYDYLVWSRRVDYSHGSAVRICVCGVYIRSDVVKPQCRSLLLKSRGRSSVYITFQEALSGRV